MLSRIYFSCYISPCNHEVHKYIPGSTSHARMHSCAPTRFRAVSQGQYIIAITTCTCGCAVSAAQTPQKQSCIVETWPGDNNSISNDPGDWPFDRETDCPSFVPASRAPASYIVFALGRMRSRSNWQLTSLEHCPNLLALVVAFALHTKAQWVEYLRVEGSMGRSKLLQQFLPRDVVENMVSFTCDDAFLSQEDMRWAYGEELAYAPAECRADHDFAIAAVCRFGGNALYFLDPKLRQDRHFLLAAMEAESACPHDDRSGAPARLCSVAYANPALLEDKDFIMRAMAFDGRVFHLADESLRGDRELVLLAAAQGHSAMVIPVDLRSDKEVILAFLEAGEACSVSYILQAIGENGLINDKDIFMGFLKLGMQQEDLERHYRYNTTHPVNNPWVRYEKDPDVQKVILDCKNMLQNDSS